LGVAGLAWERVGVRRDHPVGTYAQ
jgi:hypothetical protein